MMIFFFFNDTATTEIYTLSLHDALPISPSAPAPGKTCSPTSPGGPACGRPGRSRPRRASRSRSEEHTSELQSPCNLVCRLLLEKKKQHETSARDRTLPPTTGASMTYRDI